MTENKDKGAGFGKKLDIDGDGHLGNAEVALWLGLLTIGLLGVGGLLYLDLMTADQLVGILIGLLTGSGGAGLLRIKAGRK